MLQVLVLSTSFDSPRLTAEEAEVAAGFCYAIHDHQATKPQPVLFWWREGTVKSRSN